MEVCTNCGRQMEESVEYCPDCGQRLKKCFTPEERDRYLRDLQASIDEEKSRKKAKPHAEAKPANRQWELEGGMTMNQPPFILQRNEKLVMDASSVYYYGVSIHYDGTFVGGAFSSLFGGIASTKQVKREKSWFDSVQCHVYLTDLRIVFVKAKTGLFSTKEKGLENVVSEIPLELIQAIVSGKKMLDPTVELAVKAPDGSTNNVAFSFIGTFDRTTSANEHTRLLERDEWAQAILRHRENISERSSNAGDAEDPLKILKLRYAKGEITKEEYDQMRRDLA